MLTFICCEQLHFIYNLVLIVFCDTVDINICMLPTVYIVTITLCVTLFKVFIVWHSTRIVLNIVRMNKNGRERQKTV